MAEMGSWNGHSFIVSPNLIRSFTDLAFKGGCTTKDKTSSNQKYVARKNADPIEITMNVALDARLGCDVETEATGLIEEANNGASDYLIICGKQMYYCTFMLTEVSLSGIELTPSEKWLRCEAKLTFKQSSKNAAPSTSSSSSSSSSKKKSSKTTSTKTTSTKTRSSTSSSASQTVIAKMIDPSQSASGAKSCASSTISTAKKASSTTKTTSIAGKYRY